jgi:hypothetical protein
LLANQLSFTTEDFSAADYRLAKRRKAVLIDLKPLSEAEDILFIYENRLGECNGICRGIELGLHQRYLYNCWAQGVVRM